MLKRFFGRSFIFLLLVATILTGVYFLTPRNIEVTNNFEYMEPYEINLIKDQNSTAIGMILYFEEKFSVKNFNFYKINLRDISLKFKRHSHVSSPKLSYKKHLEIPALSEKLIDVKVKLALYSKMDEHVDLCIKGLIADIFSSVKGEFSFGTMLTGNKLVEIKEVQYINCTPKHVDNLKMRLIKHVI